MILAEIPWIKLSRICTKFTFFANKNSHYKGRKKLSSFIGLISCLAETFTKKGQNPEKRESFCL